MLITIEGIDGTGKSTLVENLKSKLTEIDPVFTREPGATWIGDLVRRGVAENIDPVAEAFLFAADHAAHLDMVVKPNLSAGKTIISDRFSDSRYAYQAVTLSGRFPDSMAWIRGIHEGWTIVPDLTFLLVIPVEDAMERLGRDRMQHEHFECRSTLEAVQKNYLGLAEEDPERFVIIDAEKDAGEIADFVSAAIKEFVSK